MDRSIVKDEFPEYAIEVTDIKIEIDETETKQDLYGGWMERSDPLYETSPVVCKEELSENRLTSEGLEEIVTPPSKSGSYNEQTAETQNNENFTKRLKYTSLNNMGRLNILTNVKASPANPIPPLEYFIEILPINQNNQGTVDSTKHKGNISRNSIPNGKIKKYNRKNNNKTIEVEIDSKNHIKPLNGIIKNNIQSQSRSLLRQDLFDTKYLGEVPTIDNSSTSFQHKTVKNINKCNKKRESISNTSRGNKRFACKFCNYKCSVKTSIVRHMQTHPGTSWTQQFLCDMEHLRRQKKHAAGKIFLCDHCNFKSEKRSSLVQHMGTHSTEKPYSCDICIYKCREKRLLTKHKMIHTGEKPFSCNICNYRCGLNSSLARHMRTHTGEKPYACKVCDYRSSRNEHLVRHMKIHPAGKLLSCNVCSFTCGLQRSLRRHIKSHV